MSKDAADDLDVRVGDRLPVQFAARGTRDLHRQAIYKDAQVGDLAITLPDFERFFTDQLDLIMFVDGTAERADRHSSSSRCRGRSRGYPNLTVRTRPSTSSAIEDQVNGFLGIIYALLALAIIIAIFGIVNTLALSIFERTARSACCGGGHQLAPGPADGALGGRHRGSARRPAGGGAGADLRRRPRLGHARRRCHLDPVGRIVIFFVLAGLAGVLAAIWPARRAAKLDVLRADRPPSSPRKGEAWRYLLTTS